MIFMRRAAEKKRQAAREAAIMKQIADAREAKRVAEEKAAAEVLMMQSHDMFNVVPTEMTDRS